MAYNRPKIAYGTVSYPDQREGGDGDIQIRQTNLGAKLFGKIGGTWYGQPLTSTVGNPVTKIGSNLSNHLSISPSEIEFFKNSVSTFLIDSFGNIKIKGDMGIGVDSPTTKLEVGDAGGSFVTLSHTPISGAAIADNDVLGRIDFAGYDNSIDSPYLGIGARIEGRVDGSWDNTNSADAPGELAFFVNNDDTSHAVGNEANCLRMIINALGNVAIGSPTPDAASKLTIQATAGTGETILFRDTDGSDEFAIGATGGAFYIFDTTGTSAQRMKIDSSGNLGIAMSPGGSHKIDVTGSAGLSTGTAWTNTSDSRIKENIQTITGGLDKINALRPVSFNYTDEYLDHHPELSKDKTYNSFIAQEYETVFPDAVTSGGKLGGDSKEDTIIYSDLKQFNPHDLFMYMAKAIQELSAKIDTMQTEINNLKAE